MRWKNVEITGGFLLLLAWINYYDTQHLLAMTMVSAALHEIGHCIAIRAVKKRITLLRLSAVGAQLQLEGPLSYAQEILIALAGPMLNFSAAFFAAHLGWNVFAGINLVLGIFNLLPIGSMDGGRIIECGSALLFGAQFSSYICNVIDFVFALVVTMVGVILLFTNGSVSLFLIAVWLWNRKRKMLV